MVYAVLFSHAKPRKNIPEDFVGGDLAGDGTDVEEGLAKVLQIEVGRGAGVEGGADPEQGGIGELESLEVAGICHQSGVLIQGRMGEIRQDFLQIGDALTGSGGNPQKRALWYSQSVK